MEYIDDSLKKEWANQMRDGIRKYSADTVTKWILTYANTQTRKLQMLKQMSDMDIPLLLGLDAGEYYSVPGFDMVEEMKLFQRAGISNYKILRSATRTAAEYFNEEKLWGTLEEGKEADMVLLSANPLVSLTAVSNIAGIFKDNKYYPYGQLEARLRE